MALSAQTVTVYPLESYKIGQKEERPDKDATIATTANDDDWWRHLAFILFPVLLFS